MLFQDLIPIILLSQKKQGFMNYKVIGCPDIMEHIIKYIYMHNLTVNSKNKRVLKYP